MHTRTPCQCTTPNPPLPPPSHPCPHEPILCPHCHRPISIHPPSPGPSS
jgi:hypothetical protein